jgi:hypothetical protein
LTDAGVSSGIAFEATLGFITLPKIIIILASTLKKLVEFERM